MAAVFQPNVFQPNVFQTVVTGEVGSRISGGSFKRGRWIEIKEQQRQAKEAAREAVRRIEARAREAIQKCATEQRGLVEARRAAQDEANRRAAIERMLAVASQLTAPPAAPIGIPQVVIEAAMRAKAEQDEEEEAVMLLLFNE